MYYVEYSCSVVKENLHDDIPLFDMIIVSQLIIRAYYSFYWLNIFTHCFVSESNWKNYWERLNHGVSEFSQEHGAKGDGHLDWEFSSRPCRPSHPVSYLCCTMHSYGCYMPNFYASLFNVDAFLGTWTANWATALFITRRTEKPWSRYGNQLEEKMCTSFKQAQSK